MYRCHLILTLVVLLTASVVADAAAGAAGTVEVELLGTTPGSSLLFQDWAQALGKAGIRNVRLRAGQDSDRPGIDTRGTPEHPVYVVTGIVLSRNELALPGGRFRRNETARLSQWINDLAARGPNAGPEKKAAFDLSPEQLEKTRARLAPPVGFATLGLSRVEAAKRIASQFEPPLRLDDDLRRELGDEKLPDELETLSIGTALAQVLRSAGYGLAPRTGGGSVAFAAVKLGDGVEVWPVGQPPKKRLPEVLPDMFESRNVNVQDVSAARAIEAIAARLKTPILYDNAALARHKIDPTKATVSLPRSRTTYGIALRRLLFQARLRYEVRCDDAGAPFLWIGYVKPE